LPHFDELIEVKQMRCALIGLLLAHKVIDVISLMTTKSYQDIHSLL